MSFVEFTTPGNITDATIDRICWAHGHSPRDVLSYNRARKLVKPRCEVARFLRSKGWSYPVVGKKMGRDHTTIMYNVTRFIGSDKFGPYIDPITGQPFAERQFKNVNYQNL